MNTLNDCRPPEGTQSGTRHVLEYNSESTDVFVWTGDVWDIIPPANIDALKMGKDGWRYVCACASPVVKDATEE
ncbi:hypothetical protein AA0472_1294 [Acetobacter estunensis NRIC 0472]|uniref:Uncharacterized protein n=1 Tax=Acetobacter estunensis TaxID=104097 RepID=A0A967B6C3_9PROT|nr:hypothetical protein [Acetobacter estunensis]NHO54029.1 hypothetical protein [Acetobacter estunensis]GBQ24059.1 hypothetical protein AA0472_1294 [Acetobacter estunensis NRIC 0472]